MELIETERAYVKVSEKVITSIGVKVSEKVIQT
jgi:hypothetical protein